MIVPMKRVTVFALRSDRRKLLSALQRRALVMVTESNGDTEKRDGRLQADEAALAETNAALDFLSGFAGKKSMLAGGEKPAVRFEELIAKESGDAAPAEEILRMKADIQSQEGRIQSLQALNQALRPWMKLPVRLDEVKDTRCTRVRTGFFPEALPEIASLERQGGAVTLLDAGPSGTAALIVAHAEEDAAVYALAKELGFADAAPPQADGTAAEVIRRNETEIASLQSGIDRLREQAKEAAGQMETLRRIRDCAATGVERSSIPYSVTDSVFFIEGWVRSDRADALRETIEGVTEYYELALRDPAEDEQPPTVTKNSRFISQFDTITDSFSRPDPRGVDPNPIMGPWYWVIFGMMMGDVGYGLMMLVLIGGFKRLTKNKTKLVNVLFYSSVTTVFWGVMFGSYFGEELLPAVIMTPLDDIMVMMGICLGIGTLHIFCGMAIKMYDDFRNKRPWDAVFDQLSWMVLLIGLVLLFVPALKTAGLIMSALGGGTVFLTAGRSKPGVLKKLTGGLGALYGITSYLSDILSYARILALMLSSGIVAMVMNILAGMVMPDWSAGGVGIIGGVIGTLFGLVIYVIGHIFNLVLSLLSAYVHDSRLQYLEFFGKFYDGGGYAFRPLAPAARYVDVTDGDPV